MPSSQMTISVDGLVNSVAAAPAGSKFYLHSMSDIPGVVAANTFLSIFNPLASGKNLVFYQATVVPWAGAATSTTASMNVFRTTAASGGTLITAANVNRFVTTDPNPVAEVRVGNPTVTTVGTTLLGVPPAITSAGVGVSAVAQATVPGGAGFVCAPGQGVAFTTTSGDVDQLWNIVDVWAEL